MKLWEILDCHMADLEEKWTKKYKKSINCNAPKGFSQRAHCAARRKRRAGGTTTSKSLSESRMDTLVESMLHNLQSQGLTETEAVAHINERLDEDLRKWFQQKWVRFGPDGKIRGACARGSEGEGKPKCLPQKKAWALGKKKRATAAARKRRQDPNPEREGKAKNVATTESVGSTKLGDLCTIKTNFPDADFWLVRRGDGKNVGKPTKQFSPYHVGIKVTATEQLMPQYLYYMMMHLYNQDYWNSRSMGMSNLVHIRTEDVKNIQLALTDKSQSNESFDRDEFLRHMAKLRAREELRKTDPVKALAKDLQDKDKQTPAKNPSDDSDLGDPHIDPLNERLKKCPHCGGPVVSEQELEEKQDACYYKVKSRYKVWPSAYASGALVQCRKKGAKNWGKGKKK